MSKERGTARGLLYRLKEERGPDGAEYIKIHDRMSGYDCHQDQFIFSVSDTRHRPNLTLF